MKDFEEWEKKLMLVANSQLVWDVFNEMKQEVQELRGMNNVLSEEIERKDKLIVDTANVLQEKIKYRHIKQLQEKDAEIERLKAKEVSEEKVTELKAKLSDLLWEIERLKERRNFECFNCGALTKYLR